MLIISIALATVIVGFSATAEGNGKFQNLKGTGYYLSQEEVTFVQSILACKTAGMELASAETADEADQIIAAINGSYNAEDYGVWIGGIYYDSEWYWVSSGKRMIYENWGSGQPIYYTEDDPYCLRIGNYYKYDQPHLWQNVNCNLRLNYVCQTTTTSDRPT